MSDLTDVSRAPSARSGKLARLKARLEPMLAEGPEARLILTSSGDILSANAAGTALRDPLTALNISGRQALITWLNARLSEELEIKLALDGSETSYVLHKVRLEGDESTSLFLIIARRPNLSGHLIQALSQSRALYKDIVHAIPGIVWETKADGYFSFVGGADVAGIDQTKLIDASPADAFKVPSEIADSVFCSPVPVQSVDMWIEGQDGARVCLSVSAKPVLSKEGDMLGARGIALDVTADRIESDAVDAASLEMMDAAERDGLTGLLNRRGFFARLEKLCGQIRAADNGGYLAMIDLDKFKQLNDTHGHAKGDAALVAVGDLLLRHTRREDIAGRLGGDEFILWIDSAHQESLHRICENLLVSMPALCSDIGLDGFGLNMSIGVTQLRPGRDTANTLTERADKIMYAVKENGRGDYLFEDGDID